MTGAFVEVPLGLDLDFPGYDRCHLDFSQLPCRALVGELARALLERTNTGGPIKSPSTAQHYRTAISGAVRWLHAQGFDGDATELTEDMVFDYWRRCSGRQEGAIRILLGHIEGRHPGRLAPGLVGQLSGIRLNPRPECRPRQPYSAGETRRLLTACTTVIEAAEARMAAVETLAGVRADPTSSDCQTQSSAGLGDRANVAWLLDRHGPHTSAGLARRLGLQQWRVARAVYFTLPELHEALFPTSEVALAFRLLVGLQTGISPEGVDNLTAGCVEWVGATDARMSWVKARGGGRQSQVFASRGRWSPGRLVERWLAYSARVRRFASDPVPLWLYCHGATFEIRKAGFWWPVREAFAARHNLRSDDGTPLRLGFGTLRATYFARHDRHWNGALRIDANHSRRVEGDHYLAQTRAIEPIEATIEAAQRDALRKASAVGLTVLTTDELAKLQGDPDGAAARLQMSRQSTSELLAGQRDVFAAACKDFHHSPYGAPGQPCPVPVWTCLCCPLAVFTPAKVPNLLRLRDHLDRQWQALPAGEWMATYGAANVRLERDILPKFSAAVITAARSVLTADDGVYLRPEENPAWPA